MTSAEIVRDGDGTRTVARLRSPSICLISFSAIADDPRVRRQGDAFHDAGWAVYAVGLPGARSPAPPWTILTQEQLEQAQPIAESTSGILPKTVEAGPVTGEAFLSASIAPAHDAYSRIRRLYRSAFSETLRTQAYRFRFKLKSGVRNGAIRFRSKLKSGVRNGAMLRAIALIATWRHRGRLLKPYFHQFIMRFRRDDGPEFYLKVPEVRRLYEITRLVKADIYLANDWHTLPIAMRAARETGNFFGYDTHEYALEEYRYRLAWRLFRRPLARSVERVGFRGALVTSTVSAGIAEDMAREYGLSAPLLVIRNTPDRRDVEFRPCDGMMTVIFHGLIARDRGLEDCIRSVALWRPEFKFVLRGPVSAEYRAELDAIARECGVTDRVDFLPPVPMIDLIREAAKADIGISTPPKTSKHNIYALPNKFFEYIQAGLALCIADLPDMGKIVKRHDLGLLIPEVTPEHIAQTINNFTVESVNRFKENSRLAAAELNWQVERQRLVGAYTDALNRVRAT
ncbi:MAG TPA: glycosyltransferase [Kaistia sp.]|nr:glycosyltransferase [Kaistia sp.]